MSKRFFNFATSQFDWLNGLKLKFILAGVLNTCFGLAVFPALFFLLGSDEIHYLAVLALSNVLSVTFAFITNKYFVFRTEGNLGLEYSKFVVFHLAHFVINMVTLPTLVHLSGLHPVLAQTAFAIAVIITSYLWHSRVTFLTR